MFRLTWNYVPLPIKIIFVDKNNDKAIFSEFLSDLLIN